jgi:hypothetical protein
MTLRKKRQPSAKYESLSDDIPAWVRLDVSRNPLLMQEFTKCDQVLQISDFQLKQGFQKVFPLVYNESWQPKIDKEAEEVIVSFERYSEFEKKSLDLNFDSLKDIHGLWLYYTYDVKYLTPWEKALSNILRWFNSRAAFNVYIIWQ